MTSSGFEQPATDRYFSSGLFVFSVLIFLLFSLFVCYSRSVSVVFLKYSVNDNTFVSRNRNRLVKS